MSKSKIQQELEALRQQKLTNTHGGKLAAAGGQLLTPEEMENRLAAARDQTNKRDDITEIKAVAVASTTELWQLEQKKQREQADKQKRLEAASNLRGYKGQAVLTQLDASKRKPTTSNEMVENDAKCDGNGAAANENNVTNLSTSTPDVTNEPPTSTDDQKIDASAEATSTLGEGNSDDNIATNGVHTAVAEAPSVPSGSAEMVDNPASDDGDKDISTYEKKPSAAPESAKDSSNHSPPYTAGIEKTQSANEKDTTDTNASKTKLPSASESTKAGTKSEESSPSQSKSKRVQVIPIALPSMRPSNTKKVPDVSSQSTTQTRAQRVQIQPLPHKWSSVVIHETKAAEKPTPKKPAPSTELTSKSQVDSNGSNSINREATNTQRKESLTPPQQVKQSGKQALLNQKKSSQKLMWSAVVAQSTSSEPPLHDGLPQKEILQQRPASTPPVVAPKASTTTSSSSAAAAAPQPAKVLNVEPDSSESKQVPVKRNENIACYKCGESGHIARKCPRGSEKRVAPGGRKCFNCGKFGHIAADCPRPVPQSKACYYCNQEGHVAKDCAKKQQRKQKQQEEVHEI